MLCVGTPKSGRGKAWYSACFGCRRSPVRIWAPRPLLQFCQWDSIVRLGSSFRDRSSRCACVSVVCRHGSSRLAVGRVSSTNVGWSLSVNMVRANASNALTILPNAFRSGPLLAKACTQCKTRDCSLVRVEPAARSNWGEPAFRLGGHGLRKYKRLKRWIIFRFS